MARNWFGGRGGPCMESVHAEKITGAERSADWLTASLSAVQAPADVDRINADSHHLSLSNYLSFK